MILTLVITIQCGLWDGFQIENLTRNGKTIQTLRGAAL
jgi:hypothetical protein